MKKMMHTAGNFQYSVNIAYDLEDAEKLKNFIPTKSSLDLLEDILLSTQDSASNRARILIGAYGKGKSHIVLSILSILKHHEPKSDFVHLNKKITENPKLNQLVENYYESGKKLLPVLITGNGTSLSQSFLMSLKNTLQENNLTAFMPKTNYLAAINVIKKWKKDYSETLKHFESLSACTAENFISDLEDFNLEAYQKFESLYPSLTAGSIFNPFLGFDVPVLYESVAKELRAQKLYDGLYVVYDEFSKYLESNIETASVSDTKMLQDFAEKACRSGKNQIHLLLISHKEIANYIDKLPKQKTDGWRGISERFEHILLNNNFSKVYEIISTVIQKESGLWLKFLSKHDEDFNLLEQNYKNHELFRGENVGDLIRQTYPLHPVSTFILPRLSEQIAQNERTLFTFLSANTEATLPSFLKKIDDSKFTLVTPDLIFDYFEPLLKKEVYSGELHEIYHLTSVILDKLNNIKNSTTELEKKIVKTLSLIYILSQFEKLKPVMEEIINIYGYSYTKDSIDLALKNLIEKEFVIYLRQSNSYLKLKETSGVDIEKTIHDETERQKKSFILSEALNAVNFDKYFYPYRYNDEKEMTRFFTFSFVEYKSISHLKDEENIYHSDGKIYGVLCNSQTEVENAISDIQKNSRRNKLCLFVILRKSVKIEKVVAKLNAICGLVKETSNDEILSSEYQVVLDDVYEIVSEYIKKYTHPEKNCAAYFYSGSEQKIKRRSELTQLLSDICGKVFADAPVINNEAINKNEITQMAFNSRRKIIAGLLRNPLEKNLGLMGSGQDVAIMRSTLLHVGILKQDDSVNAQSDFASLNFDFGEDKFHLRAMFNVIQMFVNEASNGQKCFSELYEKLVLPKYNIGIRKGIIPIYIAAVFGEIKNQLVLYHGDRQIPVNADSLALLNENPEEYFLLRFSLDESRKEYLEELTKIFSANGKSAEEIAFAIRNWYLSLSKYSREAKTEYSSFIKLFKAEIGTQELLFSRFPKVFGKNRCDRETAKQIGNIKSFYDNLILDLENELSEWLLNLFCTDSLSKKNEKSFLKAWLSSLPKDVRHQLFADGTERLIDVANKSYRCIGDLTEELALVSTGLYLKDWGEGTKSLFFERIANWKASAENFVAKKASVHGNTGNGYIVSFPTLGGQSVTKSFEKVHESVRAKLLFNKLTDALDTMGKSMSEAEKRQVLMDVLQKMCGGEN